ncbi:LuxR C-terminal-related transcriptional regulator [Ornithinimicrobium pekingense]|uniref:DNA-binding response regulator n=1 Tax=Ornithinimicrobium pekingense TaxID=384677 RepID=A0ABQ2F6Q1_9MICO|nr:response regulator transcription factor [Ornithinimicrobium pekingense]GGK63371.1 DNA-binding response regulator [Ornithinimicrobium pekingense]
MGIDVVLVAPVRAYRDALATAMSADQEVSVVAHAGSGAEALACVTPCQPAVALLDFGVDDLVRLVPALRRTAPTMRLVCFGIGFEATQAEAVVRVAEAGVCGFVDADQPLSDVVTSVRLVVRGQSSCSPRIAALLLQALQRRPAPPAWPLAMANKTPALTPREQVVAELAACGLTNRQIAARLVLGESTVKTHVHSILAKLGLRSRDEIVLSGALLLGGTTSPGGVEM